MNLTDRERAFLAKHNSAAMVTLKADGTPHAVRVGIALVDGKLWSSGTQDRARTSHLRRDSRCTLFVFDPKWNYLTIESTVAVRDGPDAPELNLQLFRRMQEGMQAEPQPGNVMWWGEERTAEDFLEIMREEGRLIYEFEPRRAYGMI